MISKHDVPVLIAQSGPIAGQRWSLAKDVFVVGRGAACDLVVPARQVSRHHARVRREGTDYLIEDLGSKNGTHVNGTLLTGPHRLQDGDVIQVALACRLIFVGSEATLPLMVEGGLPAAFGRMRVDSLARRVWIGNKEIDPPLSAPQYRLLELLYRSEGQVCTRDQIVQTVWPEAAGEGVSEQSIDALVRRLRDRIAEVDPDHQYVATVRGHGFRLDNRP